MTRKRRFRHVTRQVIADMRRKRHLGRKIRTIHCTLMYTSIHQTKTKKEKTNKINKTKYVFQNKIRTNQGRKSK